MSDFIKVCIISSSITFRQGVVHLLQESKRFIVHDCQCEISSASRLIESVNPEVILFDIASAELQELSIIHGLLDRSNDLPIAALVYEGNDLITLELINSGCKGLISKNSGIKSLCKALGEFVEGGFYISPSLLAPLQEHIIEKPIDFVSLDEDESFVLNEIGSGNIMIETCSNGDFSTDRYEMAKRKLMEKTNCTTDSALTLYFLMNKKGSF